MMKPRFCLVVPTYNNPQTIQEVIHDCIEKTTYPIFVIDDGSSPEVKVEPHARVSLHRLEKNRGKGFALQTAFQLAIDSGFTHIVTLDGDGQHFVSEAHKLIEESIRHPWAMIIGERKFTGEHVPEISRFGRKFSNFWVKFETNRPVKDSQSGFRIYPLFYVQHLKFWTKRFDFEIEVLIRLMWKGVQVREVPVDVHYPHPDERVSHFNKLWDNVRIAFLNAVLVTLSLLRMPESAFKISLAVAIGAFVGTYPFFGFHGLIVAGIAFLFRLNFIALFVGTQVSMPPMIPVIFFLVHRLERIFPLDTHFARLAISFSILAVGMSVLAFCITFAITYEIRKKKIQTPKTAWSGRTRGGRLGNHFIRWILKRGGLKLAYRVIALVIPYFYCFAPKARKSLDQYWHAVDPHLPFFARQRKILQHFYRFAQVLLDRAYQEHQEERQFKINSNGLEHIQKAVDAKRGFIMITAHVGAWDLASYWLRKKDGASEFRMVKFEADGLTYDKASGKSEAEQNHHLVHRARAGEQGALIFQIREMLQNGKLVGLMGDRPVSYQVELVKFMGKLAVFDMTAMRVARICKVPVLFSFGFKGTGNEYDFYADPPLEVVDPYATTQLFCEFLETHLKKYPDQWFNFFPFWSHVPEVSRPAQSG